mmetsp:Transcript_16194/g.39795  ORF Transcript_16194/g.39795 Transcript_16194/m.39795 type:complete len:114 (-) Transcript_16194:163-504(-)
MRVSSLSLSILLAAILCASSSVVLAQSIASAREDGTNSEKDSEEEELPLAAVRRQDMNGIDQPEDKRNLQSWGMGDLWWRSGKGKGSSSSDDGKGMDSICPVSCRFSCPRRYR